MVLPTTFFLSTRLESMLDRWRDAPQSAREPLLLSRAGELFFCAPCEADPPCSDAVANRAFCEATPPCSALGMHVLCLSDEAFP